MNGQGVLEAPEPVVLKGHPPVAPVRPVDWRRVALGLVVFGTVVAGAVLIVRGSSGTSLHAPLSFIVGLVVLPVVASPIEWFVHRFVYHEPVVPGLRPIFVVHRAHHFAFFPTWRYVTRGRARRIAIRRGPPEIHSGRLASARVRVAHFGWYLGIGVVVVWAPAWVATSDPAFLAGVAVASVIVSNLFIVVHDTIHRPRSHRIVEAQPWFAFLDRYHYIHHIDLGANLNFLLPLADRVFGTLRTQLTPEELGAHGTLDAAKAEPSGEGERLRSARGPVALTESRSRAGRMPGPS